MESSKLRGMRIIRILLTMSLLVGLLAGGTVAWGQATTSIRGTITDPSGSVVSGATVVLTNAESKAERTAITGVQGGYQFLFVPPGTYTLSVIAQGFKRYEQTGLELLVNTPATANMQLKVGAIAEVVTVTSEAPALNLVDASIGNPFNETQVKQIPLEGRNVPELLSLQAGVAYTGNRSDLDKPAYKDQDTQRSSKRGTQRPEQHYSRRRGRERPIQRLCLHFRVADHP
jgi:hypothetical protein